MERKKKIIPLPIIGLLAFALILANSPLNPVVNVLCAGTPDAFGNQIDNVTVYQGSVGSWTQKGLITSANYTNGFEIEVDADDDIYIVAYVRLNSSLADDVSDANAKTQVNVTISGGGATGWSNHTLALNQTAVLVGSYYIIQYGDDGGGGTDVWSEAGHPSAGTSYTFKVYYNVYR